MPAPNDSRARWSAALAAVLYLGVALWVWRPVLPAPSERLPFLAELAKEPRLSVLDRGDQRLSVWGAVRNAWIMATGRWDRFSAGQCYPVEQSYTLGDHMLGMGFLGVGPWLLTRDPIATYNLMLVLTLWIPALAMYALAWHWTRSGGAALVAGLLFAFHPQHVIDPSHPSVHGNMWTPLVLLFMHLVFTRRRWRDVLGLVLFLGLQTLESFYQLLACALLGGVYGLYLLARHVRVLPAVLPKLLVAGAGAAGIAYAVLGPYLHAKARWGVLGGRSSIPYTLHQFLPGQNAYPGSVVLALAAVALIDRLRGPRPHQGEDPRLALLVAALGIVWLVVWPVHIPGLGITVPSPVELLRGVLPGLDAVRALPVVRLGSYLVLAFLAAYGVLALVERRRSATRAAVTAIFALAAVAEVFYPPVVTQSFGTTTAMAAFPARPPAPVLALYQDIPDGAVLDLPLRFDLQGKLRDMAYYLFLGAYHRQPLAACYNSFTTPLQEDLAALADHLADPGAADALHALGFRTIVLHADTDRPADARRLAAELAQLTGRVAERGRGDGKTLYRLESAAPVSESLAALRAAPDASDAVVEVRAPGARLPFTFRNTTSSAYVHPRPIEPAPLLLRWTPRSGETMAEYHITLMLPLALAPGQATVRNVIVPVPPAGGEYEVTLRPAEATDLVVTRQIVRVRAAAGS